MTAPRVTVTQNPVRVRVETRAPDVYPGVRLPARLSDEALDARIDARVDREGATAKVVALLGASLNNACKYYLNTAWPAAYPGTSPITSFGGTSEHYIRPFAASAYAVAAAISLGVYDSAVTGVSEAAAKAATLRMANSLCSLHKANGGTWGGSAGVHPLDNNAQEGLWASFVASALHLLWADVSAGERSAALAMIHQEAQRIVDWQSWPTWKDAGGAEIAVGNTYSEDIAWFVMPLAVALAMEPAHIDAGSYRLTIARASVFQNAIEADLNDDIPVNGITPADTLTGWNINTDGTVVNHGIIHPDYMVSAGSTLYGVLPLDVDAGVSMPGAVGRNAELIWAALVSRRFKVGEEPYVTPGGSPWPTAGPARAPGGTIYPWPPGEGFYYPHGADWGAESLRVADKLTFDCLAFVYGWDQGHAPGAEFWAAKHAAAQLALQSRFATGQTYTTDDYDEDAYGYNAFGAGSHQPLSREAWVGNQVAQALHTLMSGAVAQTWDDLTAGDEPDAWAATISGSAPGMWWRLGEASGTTIADSSGNGRATTLTNFGTAATLNQPSLVAADASNAAMKFNGGSRIRYTDVAWIGAAQTYAIAFNRTALPAGNETLMCRAASGGVNRLFSVTLNTSGYLVVTVRKADTTSSTITTDVNVCDSAAHMVVVTITGGGYTLYVDGEVAGQDRFASANLAATDPIAIGSLSDAGNPTSAALDEFIVWPRAVHEQEVASLYRAFIGA